MTNLVSQYIKKGLHSLYYAFYVIIEGIFKVSHSWMIIALKQYRLYHSNDTASLAWLQVSLFTWLAIPV